MAALLWFRKVSNVWIDGWSVRQIQQEDSIYETCKIKKKGQGSKDFIIAACRCFTIPFSCIRWVDATAAPEPDEGEVDYQQVFVKNSPHEIEHYGKKEKVRIIIEMDKDALLEQPQLRSYSSVQKYAISGRGQNKQNKWKSSY